VASDFNCNKAGHSANASLITIPSVNNDEAQMVYLLHAHAPLTQKMRTQFEKMLISTQLQAIGKK
jgi:hypothetical protein